MDKFEEDNIYYKSAKETENPIDIALALATDGTLESMTRFVGVSAMYRKIEDSILNENEPDIEVYRGEDFTNN